MRNPHSTRTLFDLSETGRRATVFAPTQTGMPPVSELLPFEALAEESPALPELSEPDIVRHFVNLSTLNMSVDTHFYPLGSCTMKYNPKRHERLASLSGLVDLHPYLPDEAAQGILRILFELQEMLAEIAGLPAVSLHPAAGAQGEFTALLTANAYFRDKGEHRTKVIFPSSAHGTNPASAALAGFECVQLKRSETGLVDLQELQSHLDDQTAVFMITNPNTIGLFEPEIAQISRMLHDVGGLVYIDGANMNAILGKTRPGDFGGDMMHYNVHKTFTGPHGGGGPGAGPIAVQDFLADYLPAPVVVKEVHDGKDFYRLSTPQKSIGQVRSFFGNVGILLRGYFYLKTLGAVGVREVSEQAVLNANYLLSQIQDFLPAPDGERCMHEFVASASNALADRGISAMDIAKRLLDYGFHAPTVYFPIDVPEAMMMEPTETESKATLDSYAKVLRKIVLEEDPDLVHQAPLTTPVSRPDEVQAARQPVLKATLPETMAVS